MLIYDENPVGQKFRSLVPYHEQNAMNPWRRHYSNSLMLKFFLMNGSTREKIQAQKELTICERKMKHWESHVNFDKKKSVEIAEDLKKNWMR
mgnify:CR=1 FL=1